MPPYLDFHAEIVLGCTPCRRPSSTNDAPASCSLRIETICVSVKRDFRMRASFRPFGLETHGINRPGLPGQRQIEHSDVVFGAVDSARARNNIERICRSALVPYIDIGLMIQVAEDDVTITAIGGQIVTSLPGGPCLWCAEVVTNDLILRDREEYLAGRPDQQVISMNGLLASQAVNGMLAVMAGYAPGFPVPAMIRYDGLSHTMQPDRFVQGPCPHYPLEAAGWRYVLPARVATA
jgi:ThiF family protein